MSLAKVVSPAAPVSKATLSRWLRELKIGRVEERGVHINAYEVAVLAAFAWLMKGTDIPIARARTVAKRAAALVREGAHDVVIVVRTQPTGLSVEAVRGVEAVPTGHGVFAFDCGRLASEYIVRAKGGRFILELA